MKNKGMIKFGALSVCLLLCVGMMTSVLGYDRWLQTSKDERSTGYTVGITMYPVNEFPRPTGGGNPTYAYIDDLTEPLNPNNGNIQTHIAAWYEGNETEEDMRVAFTTTNSDSVGAMYLVDGDGDNVGNYPLVFEDGQGNSIGNIESSIAVYYDENPYPQEKMDTLLVAAVNDPNQLVAFDLDRDLFWWFDCGDWESVWWSPVIFEHPPWGDFDDSGHEDDYVYVPVFDDTTAPGRTKIVSVDLTEAGLQQNQYEVQSEYSSEWYEGMTPTSCTPVILSYLIDPQTWVTYLFFMLDEWTYSENLQDWVKSGTRVICIDIDPNNLRFGAYDEVFSIQLPVYDSLEIPGTPPESIDLRYTVTTDPVVVETREFVEYDYADWNGIVFGTDDGSDGTGWDVFFVEEDGTISEKYDLSYPSTPPGGGSQQQTDPIVVGSPAVRPNPAVAYQPDEIYVLYKDRTTGRTGVAYFDEITDIGANRIFQYPTTLPDDGYLPMSPVITHEFLYVGCGYQRTTTPYGYCGGMLYISMENIRANGSCGFFHELPWSLDTVTREQHWLATPAIIQVSSTEQYLFMGTAAADLDGGYLWRLST